MSLCDYIRQHHGEREYANFLRRKVEVARGQIAEGKYRSNDEVEASFAARRAQLRLEAGKAKA